MEPAPCVVDEWFGLFRAHGDRRYQEAVTQTQHACQTAQLAERQGASPALVAAALLHDVGHLIAGERSRVATPAGRPISDDLHETVAAEALGAHLPREVTDPILLHVVAKRYLVTVDPAYLDTLSPASVHSLQIQGGPLASHAVEDFEALAHADAAVRLRRWDDAAKVPDEPTPPLDHYVPLLVELVSDQLGAGTPS